ncbi:LPS-assembly protein LptD [Gammaproteobacteria bacterium]
MRFWNWDKHILSLLRFVAPILSGFLAVSSTVAEESMNENSQLEKNFKPCNDDSSTINTEKILDQSLQNNSSHFPFLATSPSKLETEPSIPFPLVKTSPRKPNTLDWSFCADTVTQSPSLMTDQPLDRATPIDIESDQATIYEQSTAILWGNVQLSRPGELLKTPWLLYDLDLDTAQAQYGLRYRRGGLALEGEEGFFDLQSQRGTITAAHYQLAARHARGTAAIIRMDDHAHGRFTNATYSTCPEGRDDWILRAQVMDLDQERERGTGYHVTAYFKDVPLFYLPYLSFPISGKRESGFLIPSIGTSSRSGLDLRIPYYWNIAPNHDATFTTRLLTRRGVQFDTEFRYLTRRSSGEVSFEYLPQDKLRGKERSLFSFHHEENITPRAHSDIIFNAVSDNNYFRDLGNNLTFSSFRYLERRADFLYSGDGWSALGRAQAFQVMDDGRPFERLPQIQVTFNSPDNAGRLTEYATIGEISNFYRNSIIDGTTFNQNYTGSRFWLQPAISYPINGLNGFFIPRLTLHQVNYSLKDTAPGLPSAPDLTLPIFSTDAGLFLERNFTSGNRHFVQTLEPRLYYLYVPYKNQKNLPIFDTTLLDFSFGQLFRENRFSGPDRQGDANQVALALTSRFFDSGTGTQFLYGSLGQILYFRDRLVNLDYGTNNVNLTNEGTASARSEVLAEVGARLGKFWTANSTLQWNQQQGQPEKRTVRLRYQSDQNHLVNFSFRNRRDLLEQTDLSMIWPLNRQWRAVARWNYSFKDSQTLESFAGLRYDSCCWALQIIGRRYVNLPGEDPKSDVMFQLELKGLANIGEKLDLLLTNNIFGYLSTK